MAGTAQSAIAVIGIDIGWEVRKAFFAPSSILPRLAETGSLNSTTPNRGTRSASARASVTDCVDRPSGWRLVGEPAARLPRVGQREARSLPERWPAVPRCGEDV
jgi:hypothetical protein